EVPGAAPEGGCVTEAKWLARPHHHGPRLSSMIDFLRARQGNQRRLRLFACACCRRVWDLLRPDAARKAVELAEAYADGAVPQAELSAAHDHPDRTGVEALLRGEKGPKTRFSARAVFAIEAAQFLAAPSFLQFSGGPNFVVSLTSRDPAHDFIPDPGWYS